MKNKVLSIVTGLSVLALAGCGGSSSSSSSVGSTTDSCAALDSATFNCTTMLNDIVDYSVKPLVADFATKVQALQTQTTEYCSSITAANTPSASETAAFEITQQAWQETMDVWQQLEVMQFGPLLAQREQFYSWPLNDSCKVDEEVVFSLESGYDISSGVTPARRGLDAFEYLIFNTAPGLSCPLGNTTQAMSDWNNSRGDAQKREERCDYAAMVSDDLVTRSTTLSQAYADYDIISDAGSLQQAANLVSDGLFYIDKKTKDAKLLDPLAEKQDDTFKEEDLEFGYANAAKEAIHNNLKGALAIMDGTDGNGGLGDYLVAAGQTGLAEEMIAELNTSINNSSNTYISQSFREIMVAATDPNDVAVCINAVSGNASASDFEKMCSLDNDIRAFTDDLKGQFLLTLDLIIPTEAAGDND